MEPLSRYQFPTEVSKILNLETKEFKRELTGVLANPAIKETLNFWAEQHNPEDLRLCERLWTVLKACKPPQETDCEATGGISRFAAKDVKRLKGEQNLDLFLKKHPSKWDLNFITHLKIYGELGMLDRKMVRDFIHDIQHNAKGPLPVSNLREHLLMLLHTLPPDRASIAAAAEAPVALRVLPELPIDKHLNSPVKFAFGLGYRPYGNLDGAYEQIKSAFKDKPYVCCEFNDEDASINFYHDPSEIILFLNIYGIQDINHHIDARQNEYPGPNGCSYIQMSCNFREKETALIKEAEIYIAHHSKEQIDIIAEEQKKKPIEALTSMLSKYPGVCVGEVHSKPITRQFITEHMKALKKSGLDTLYMEHLCFDSPMQRTLDDYCASEDLTMPTVLHKFLEMLDRGYNRAAPTEFGFLRLIETAKKQGIRIVGIDTTVARNCGVTREKGVTNSKKRYLGMNAVATRIIETDTKRGDGKYIAFMGNGHLATVSEDQVAGVAELLSVPSVNINRDKEKHKGVYYSEKGYHGVSHLTANMYV
ncbi:MAG: membrane-targeted effector domain-containing toxin [Parachlamydiaceae bacterium]